MSDNEKRLRYDVLMTAIGVVDTNYFQRKENGESLFPPTSSEYIKKAEEFLKFIEAGQSTPTKQLLSETDTNVGC